MGLERAYPTRAEFLDHIRRDWRSAHSIRKGIYDYVELDYSKIKGLTAGSVPYAGATGYLTQDNANFFWDYTNKRLNIGTLIIEAASITDSDGSISFGNDNLVTTGTLGCGGPLTITQNSDTVIISHDGTNAYINWSDGALTFRTAEGTNTITEVHIKGLGTKQGILRIYDQDDAEWFEMFAYTGHSYIRTAGATPGTIRFQDNVSENVILWFNIISGNPYFYIYGYESGVGKKYLRQRIESDGDALIEAQNDLNILAGGGNISFGDENLFTTGTLGAGQTTLAKSTLADDARGLSSIFTLSANPAKSDGIAFYSEGHIGAITTDGPTYGAGIWLNIDSGAILGADVRALDIGIYESGATCSGRNAYGLAIHMEFDNTNPPLAIYPFRLNCNMAAGHATPDALIFAANEEAIALIVGDPGTADDAYLKIVLQNGDVYRIPLVKE